MAAGSNRVDAMPVFSDIKKFDHRSGNWLERLIFNHRLLMVAFCAVLTVLLGLQALKLEVNAGFEKMLPQGHPYIQNYLENQDELRGLGNAIRVVVENVDGDIFDPEYLELLRQVNDELFLTPGVDRAWMKSLWTPAVRWTEVTEEGFSGGPVMPDAYDGSVQSVDELKLNIARSGIVGQLVANNFKSSMIFVPLIERNPQTGERLDYSELSRVLEENIRTKFEQIHPGEEIRVRIHIIGFAKLVGDLLDGLTSIMSFFLVAAIIVAGLIYAYNRCVRSTLMVLVCSITAVIWQLGIIRQLGFELDPYTVLVPFLIFAIAISHGAQKMNGILQDVGRGTHKLVAARYTFRRLFLAGLTALLSDAVGFAVLMVIDIPVIRDLALTATVGIAVLIITNLLLLPVLLSFIGVSPKAAARSLKAMEDASANRGWKLWILLNRFTERRWATAAIVVAVSLTVMGLWISRDLQIGDLDAGAPELRPDSQYNRDNAYVTANYALSSDLFAVIVKTPAEGCLEYESLVEADRLSWQLRQLPGVQTTTSLVDAVRQVTAGSYEGNLKWLTINRNQDVLNYGAQQAAVNNPALFNSDCSVMPVIAYLADHKAATLDRVVETAAAFAEQHSREDLQFLLAAGNAGVEAATNIVVSKTWYQIMFMVYAGVGLFCFITFRNWRAVVVAVVPLMVTSVLCEALMVFLGIGVKVATLPVIALGVGIGVDYALYLISVQLAHQKQGVPLTEAYRRAIQLTGKVVALIGVTLAAGVITWVFSPIKFQADMGILLTFMFVWNMVGALILIPALSHFLLPDIGSDLRVPIQDGERPVGKSANKKSQQSDTIRASDSTVEPQVSGISG
ncbi:MMPL family transporter [Halopseudomonas sp. Lyrl_26]|uniref:efflux RND transporter permease subunit n=1 Tax=Halopseudomonas sp. Lyrl_26 TaxID=3110923 RepID=UPI003F820821